MDAQSVVVGTELVWPTPRMVEAEQAESRVNLPLRGHSLAPRAIWLIAFKVMSRNSIDQIGTNNAPALGFESRARSPAIKLRYQSIMIDIF